MNEENEKGSVSIFITDADREEIGKLVSEGYTSGILDRDGARISWNLNADIFEN